MSGLSFLRKKQPDVKATVRSSQRDIQRNAKDLEREALNLKREEAKLIKDIKEAAARGNVAGSKLLARQLVRLRSQASRLHASGAQLRGVSASLTTAAATHTVANSMANAGRAMAAVGAAADSAAAQRNAAQFARENARLEMAGEVMEGSLDAAFDGEEVEGEADDVMNQVLDEIGIDLATGMSTAPRQRAPAAAAAVQRKEDEDLSARIAALTAGG